MEVTVKTLDARNHSFTVSQEFTVREFKEEISATVSIPAAEQRLIFRGRVLQDDKKLSEYNVANNTVHLVQRPAQSGNSQNDEPPRNSGGGDDQRFNLEGGGGGGIIITAGTNPTDRNAIIMGTIGIPTIDIPVSEQSVNATGIRSNSAAMRLKVGNEMINKASDLLQRLEDDDELAQVTSRAANDTTEPSSSAETDNHHESGWNDGGSMEIDADDPASLGRMISQVANAASTAAVLSSMRAFQNPVGAGAAGSTGAGAGASASAGTGANVPGTGGNSENSESENAGTGEGRSQTGSSTSNRRAEAPRLREMATAVQDLLAFHDRLTPFLRFVQNVLRENRVHSAETGELRSVQYAFDTVSSVLHLLGHSYHAISDLMCDFATAPENRRITAPATIVVEQSTVVRATIPIAVPTALTADALHMHPNQQPQAPTNPSSNGPASSDVPRPPSAVPQQPPQQQQQQQQPQQQAFGGFNPLNFFPSLGIPQGGPGGPGGISINIQSNGMPDLAALLGPALAGAGAGVGAAAGGGAPPAGMLPFLSLGGLQASLRQQQQQHQQQQQLNNGARPQAQGQNATNPPSRENASVNSASRPNATNQTSNAGGNSVNAGIPGNLPHSFRGEAPRPPFDVLLNCHSHHSTRAATRRRPDDLHQHISVIPRPPTSDSVDLVEGLCDIVRFSTVLEALQPTLKDLVQNYLMRGRDIKNSQHVLTCAKSLAKKFMPFFQSLTDSISTRNDKIDYQKTFSEFITKFYFKLLSLVVKSDPNRQFRVTLLLLLEESLSQLFAVFHLCFPNNNRVPEIFVKAIIGEYFVSMPLVFRSYAIGRVIDLLHSFVSRAETNNITPETAGVIFKSDEDAIDEDIGFTVTKKSATPSSSSLPAATSRTEPGTAETVLQPAEPVLPSTSSVTSVPSSTLSAAAIEAMETDIDDMVDQIAVPSSAEPKNEDPLRNIPEAWRDTVRYDIRRQLGMPEQPPRSSGFLALFPRRN